jgi:hypothetical protein
MANNKTGRCLYQIFIGVLLSVFCTCIYAGEKYQVQLKSIDVKNSSEPNTQYSILIGKEEIGNIKCTRREGSKYEKPTCFDFTKKTSVVDNVALPIVVMELDPDPKNNDDKIPNKDGKNNLNAECSYDVICIKKFIREYNDRTRDYIELEYTIAPISNNLNSQINNSQERTLVAKTRKAKVLHPDSYQVHLLKMEVVQSVETNSEYRFTIDGTPVEINCTNSHCLDKKLQKKWSFGNTAVMNIKVEELDYYINDNLGSNTIELNENCIKKECQLEFSSGSDKLIIFYKVIPKIQYKLSNNLELQIQDYIPHDQQKIFIETHVAKLIPFNKIFQFKSSNYSGSGSKLQLNILSETDNDVSILDPSYFVWDSNNANISFDRSKNITLKSMRGKTIAYPILSWMLSERGQGRLALKQQDRISHIYDLKSLINDKHERLKTSGDNQRSISVRLPKGWSIALGNKNSLTVSYNVGETSFGLPLVMLEGDTVKALLPQGKFNIRDININAIGIYSLLKYSSYNETEQGYSFQPTKNFQSAKLIYPENYSKKAQKKCNLKLPKTSVIASRYLKARKTKKEYTIYISNCPYLVDKPIAPIFDRGLVKLDLSNAQKISVKFQAEDLSLEGWSFYKSNGELYTFNKYSEVDILELPSTSFRLFPPSTSITFDDFQVNAKNFNNVTNLNELRINKNPFKLRLPKPTERKAFSYIGGSSVWSKIRFKISSRNSTEDCSIQDQQLVCKSGKKPYLKQLLDSTIEAEGMTALRRTRVSNGNLSDILCGNWFDLLGTTPGVDVIIQGKTPKLLNISYGGNIFPLLKSPYSDHLYGYQFNYEESRISKEIYTENHSKKFSKESAVFVLDDNGFSDVNDTRTEKKPQLCRKTKRANMATVKRKKVDLLTPPFYKNKNENDNVIFLDFVFISSPNFYHSDVITNLNYKLGKVTDEIEKFSQNRQVILSFYLVYTNVKDVVSIKLLSTVNDVTKDIVTKEFGGVLDRLNKPQGLSRRIKNQIPIALKQLQSQWTNHKDDHYISLVLFKDKINNKHGLQLGEIKRKLNQAHGKREVVLLANKQSDDNRLGKFKTITTVNDDWVTLLFKTLKGEGDVK